jgi:hypothetical protein
LHAFAPAAHLADSHFASPTKKKKKKKKKRHKNDADDKDDDDDDDDDDEVVMPLQVADTFPSTFVLAQVRFLRMYYVVCVFTFHLKCIFI